jgi:hypothetical protein
MSRSAFRTSAGELRVLLLTLWYTARKHQALALAAAGLDLVDEVGLGRALDGATVEDPDVGVFGVVDEGVAGGGEHA